MKSPLIQGIVMTPLAEGSVAVTMDNRIATPMSKIPVQTLSYAKLALGLTHYHNPNEFR
jgi:hypothetical protein